MLRKKKKRDPNQLLTPEELVAQRKAELKRKLAKQPPSWLARWVDSDPKPGWGLWSLLLLAGEIGSFMCMRSLTGDRLIAGTFLLAIALFFVSLFSAVKRGDDAPMRMSGIMDFFCFFLTPIFVIRELPSLLSCIALLRWDFTPYAPSSEDIQKDLENLEADTAALVSDYYKREIARAREELLGRESPMKITELKLERKLNATCETLTRLKQDQSLEQRPALKALIDNGSAEVQAAEAVLTAHRDTMRKIGAVFDEYFESELIRQLDGNLREQKIVAAQAEQAVQETLQRNFPRLHGLETAVKRIRVDTTIAADAHKGEDSQPLEDESDPDKLAERLLMLERKQTG